MKILLCGFHEAGYRVLRLLVAQRHEVMVATHPTPYAIPSVGALADTLGIACVEGTVDEVYDAACRFRPDILLSVYYRLILPDKVLDLAPQGAFNFHPSLLPRHSGCFSAPWAIIDGDQETGVTCHRMIGQVDAGEVIDVNRVSIGVQETGMSLYYRLVDSTLDLLARVIRRVEQEPLSGSPQQGDRSYHGRAVPYDGLIIPSWSRARIGRVIRALDFPPFPPAAIIIDGQHYPVRSLEEYDECLARCGNSLVNT